MRQNKCNHYQAANPVYFAPKRGMMPMAGQIKYVKGIACDKLNDTEQVGYPHLNALERGAQLLVEPSVLPQMKHQKQSERHGSIKMYRPHMITNIEHHTCNRNDDKSGQQQDVSA